MLAGTFARWLADVASYVVLCSQIARMELETDGMRGRARGPGVSREAKDLASNHECKAFELGRLSNGDRLDGNTDPHSSRHLAGASTRDDRRAEPRTG